MKKRNALLNSARIRFLFRTVFDFIENLRFCGRKFLFAVFRSCVICCFGVAAKASGKFQVCLNQIVFQQKTERAGETFGRFGVRIAHIL